MLDEQAGREASVRGVHVNWTAPSRAGRARPGATAVNGYSLPAFEVVTMIHSVRSWRSFHGPVDMYTDEVGLGWMSGLGLIDLYDTVDADVLDEVDTPIIDPCVYYALGKVLALDAINEPVTWLDTDLYLEQPIHGLCGERFMFAHFEAVGNEIYPSADQLPDPNLAISPSWDFAQPATNMAIAYFGSLKHKESFVRGSLAYAAGNNAPSSVHRDARQVFAEQRVAPFEAANLGVEMVPVFPTTWDPDGRTWLNGAPDAAFHHTWLGKHRMARDPGAARRYLRQEMAKLTARFPDERERLVMLDERGLFSGLLAPGEAAELPIASGG